MPGGVVEKPSERTRNAICKRLPLELYPFVESAAVHYRIEAAHKLRAPAPREVRERLERIASHAAALYVELGTLSEETRNALLDALPIETGWQILESTELRVGWLIGAAQNAALTVEVSDGRPTPPEHDLVRRLANLIRGHGLEADGSDNGLLVHVTRELLEEYNARIGDVPRMVRRVLAKT